MCHAESTDESELAMQSCMANIGSNALVCCECLLEMGHVGVGATATAPTGGGGEEYQEEPLITGGAVNGSGRGEVNTAEAEKGRDSNSL